MKCVFVILHYETYRETANCIESIIENVKYETFEIVIVDNCSTNSSYDRLLEKYGTYEKIHLHRNEQNLGFAKGNNVGYSIAKKSCNADFIIMMNNDMLIHQPEFLDNIIISYQKHHFHILGPDIICPNTNLHQNPFEYDILDKNKLRKYIREYSFKLFLEKTTFICKIKNYLRNNISEDHEKEKHTFGREQQQFNVPLHGSCLIFSPEYIKRYRGLFDKTFMYLEEYILFYIAQQEDLKLIYEPSIKILHLDDAATNAVFQNNHDKKVFFLTNIVKSAKVFLEIIDNPETYKQNIFDTDLSGDLP